MTRKTLLKKEEKYEKKSIGCITYIGSFSFVVCNVVVFADDTLAHVEFLKSVGAIDGNFNTAISVTRGDFVALLMKVLYKGVDYNGITEENAGNPFNDVFPDDPNFGYIKAAKDIKIINGNAFNNFYPDREITVTEAIVMLVNAYGYTYIANAGGGYPTGYLTVAKLINNNQSYKLYDYGMLLAKSDNTPQIGEAGIKKLSVKNKFNSVPSVFGLIVYGNAIKNGESYYIRPYAEYEKDGQTIVIYGETDIYTAKKTVE